MQSNICLKIKEWKKLGNLKCYIAEKFSIVHSKKVYGLEI
jgi:hypothetical protein